MGEGVGVASSSVRYRPAMSIDIPAGALLLYLSELRGYSKQAGLRRVGMIGTGLQNAVFASPLKTCMQARVLVPIDSQTRALRCD